MAFVVDDILESAAINVAVTAGTSAVQAIWGEASGANAAASAAQTAATTAATEATTAATALTTGGTTAMALAAIESLCNDILNGLSTYFGPTFDAAAYGLLAPGGYANWAQAIYQDALSAKSEAGFAHTGTDQLITMVIFAIAQMSRYTLDTAGLAAFDADVTAGHTVGSGIIAVYTDPAEANNTSPVLNPHHFVYTPSSGPPARITLDDLQLVFSLLPIQF